MVEIKIKDIKMEFIKFPSIEQFRHVIQKVTNSTRYVGKDEETQKPIYDYNKELPTIEFIGTTKIHGTNFCIGYNPIDSEFWFQSRNNIITPIKDNLDSARFAYDRLDCFKDIVSKIENPNNENIWIYGEFAGKGIQDGVSVSEVEKFFTIFKIKVGNIWLSDDFINGLDNYTEYRIFNSLFFGHKTIQIDFNKPELSQNKLIEMTLEIEQECPVGKAFGISGIGEGLVFSAVGSEYNSSEYWFKSKGEKHSVTKVKKLVEVDVEKIKSNEEFVEKTVTENRLRQGLEYLKEMKIELSPKSTGDFIRWVHNDILKEEKDVMDISGISEKDLGKLVSVKAKTWFFQNM
jgi:hypothetical protein